MTLRQAQDARPPDSDAPVETMWTGKWIVAKRQGRWEYVSRTRGIRAVVILAVDAEDRILLIDQYRVPIGRRCLELPAGLVGDETEGEAIETAAVRELEEETGFTAERVEVIGEFYSSPGMVSECFTLVRAHGLSRVGAGGGTEHEDITVHAVPLAEVKDFIAARRAEGVAMDVKLLTLLGQSLV